MVRCRLLCAVDAFLTYCDGNVDPARCLGTIRAALTITRGAFITDGSLHHVCYVPCVKVLCGCVLCLSGVYQVSISGVYLAKRES